MDQQGGALPGVTLVVKHQASGFVTGVVTVAGRLFLIADVPRLIGEEIAS